MRRQRTNIYLDERQLRLLRHLAAARRTAVAEIVRDAVNAYLARELGDRSAAIDALAQLLAAAQPGALAGKTPEELEAEAVALVKDVRAELRADHALKSGARGH